MVQLTYNQATMAQATGDIVAASGKFTATRTEIESDMKTLMGTWTEGAGMAAYQRYQTEWNTIFNEVQQALTGLGNAVETASGNATATDNAIAKGFSA